MKTVNFELGKEIRYSNGTGQDIECNLIELREPTGRVSHICCEIESLIQSSAMKMAGLLDDETIKQAKEEAKEKEGKEEEEKMDADTALSLMTSSGANMKKVVLHFRELFKQVAWMGAEKQITDPRLDDMSHSDLKKMMGTYAANFILN